MNANTIYTHIDRRSVDLYFMFINLTFASEQHADIICKSGAERAIIFLKNFLFIKIFS